MVVQHKDVTNVAEIVRFVCPHFHILSSNLTVTSNNGGLLGGTKLSHTELVIAFCKDYHDFPQLMKQSSDIASIMSPRHTREHKHEVAHSCSFSRCVIADL